MSERPQYAFLAGGQLYVDLADDEGPREVSSTFADEYKSRVRKLQRKDAWKKQGSGARFMAGGALWGDDLELDAVPVSFTGLAKGPDPGQLLYALSTGVVGGVFVKDPATDEEKRLFHSAEHRIEELSSSPDHGVVACTMRGKDGSSCIAVMAPDGSMMSEVTDGDVIDLAPSWLPEAAASEADRRHQLVFQSAGIGRDEAGQFVAIGPASVVMLDAEHGEMQPLLEGDEAREREYLAPQMDADRTLYAIRRPYHGRASVNPFRVLGDVLLFPFRLIAALVNYLSFFTMRYTGKPLLRSGSARQRSADLRQMMMTGNLLQAHAEANAEAQKRAAEAVRDWALIALPEKGGEPEVLAKRVRAFDRLDDGRFLITDGVRVELLTPGGKREQLTEKLGITRVLAI